MGEKVLVTNSTLPLTILQLSLTLSIFFTTSILLDFHLYQFSKGNMGIEIDQKRFDIEPNRWNCPTVVEMMIYDPDWKEFSWARDQFSAVTNNSRSSKEPS